MHQSKLFWLPSERKVALNQLRPCKCLHVAFLGWVPTFNIRIPFWFSWFFQAHSASQFLRLVTWRLSLSSLESDCRLSLLVWSCKKRLTCMRTQHLLKLAVPISSSHYFQRSVTWLLQHPSRVFFFILSDFTFHIKVMNDYVKNPVFRSMPYWKAVQILLILMNFFIKLYSSNKYCCCLFIL